MTGTREIFNPRNSHYNQQEIRVLFHIKFPSNSIRIFEGNITFIQSFIGFNTGVFHARICQFFCKLVKLFFCFTGDRYMVQPNFKRTKS